VDFSEVTDEGEEASGSASGGGCAGWGQAKGGGIVHVSGVKGEGE
jgi:hypothetical protein